MRFLTGHLLYLLSARKVLAMSRAVWPYNLSRTCSCVLGRLQREATTSTCPLEVAHHSAVMSSLPRAFTFTPMPSSLVTVTTSP